MQGSLHPEALCLFRSALEPTRYPAQVNGKNRLLTVDEYAATFPGQKLPYTGEARQRKSLKSHLKCRISPRFRQLGDIKKSRALIRAKKLPQELMPKLTNGSMTATQELLLAFFFKQFIYYGSSTLPVCFTRKDPTEDSDT